MTQRPADASPPREALTPEAADQFATALGAAIARDLGGPTLLNPEGWRLASASKRYLMQRHVPVAQFEREGRTLAFIVTPSDPAEPAYKRTARYDLVYFSEDVPDAEQNKIYQRDRTMIDRFAAWLAGWDARGRGAL